MWYTIAKKEIRSSFRNRQLYIVTAIIWLLLLVAALGGYKNYKSTSDNREQASKMFRHEWEEQKANPHSAAHFGTYLFRPQTFVSLLDIGINNFTGTTYRVEAHAQHDLDSSQAEASDIAMRLGELTVALIFQILIPLIALFLAFSSITGEREQHTLKMLYMQGVKPIHLLIGKIAGNYLLLLFFVAPAILFMVGCLLLNFSSDPISLRMVLLIVFYLVYFFVITSLFVFISVLCKNSKASLLCGLGAWMIFCILLPRITTGIADDAYTLPSRFEFNKNVSTGYSKGINDDKDVYKRREDYLKQVLAQYKVDTVTKLPVNFDGLSMQYGEDYQSKVYDLYINGLYQKLEQQQRILSAVSFIDPFMSIQQLSAGLSGSDVYHYVDFQKRATKYRNEFIRTLNMDMAHGDPKYLSYDYTIGPDFFKRMKNFDYRLPKTWWVLKSHLYSVISLSVWCLAIVMLIVPVSRHIKKSIVT